MLISGRDLALGLPGRTDQWRPLFTWGLPGRPAAPGRSAGRGEAGLGGPQILLGIDADRGLGRLADRDANAVLKEPEPLQALRDLQRRGWQPMERLQRRLAIRIEADVLVAHGPAAVAVERDPPFREVQRAPVGAEHHLVDLPGVDLVGRGPNAERAHERVGL